MNTKTIFMATNEESLDFIFVESPFSRWFNVWFHVHLHGGRVQYDM